MARSKQAVQNAFVPPVDSDTEAEHDEHTEEVKQAPGMVRVENSHQGDINLNVEGKMLCVPGGKIDGMTGKFTNGALLVDEVLFSIAIEKPAILVYFETGMLVEA